MRRTIGTILLGAALLLPATAAAGGGAATGEVRGRVRLRVEGVRLPDVGPIVVFLEGEAGNIPYEVPAHVPRVHQRNATFSPAFLVIAAGQTVEMPNDDVIFHNVFSYSKPNRFDLGLYRKGTSRSVTLRYPGAVRIYCSIHESMNGIIFVAPLPWFGVVRATGDFTLTNVPAGRYRLRTWSEKLPEASRRVEVSAGESVLVNLEIGEGSGGTPDAKGHGRPVSRSPAPAATRREVHRG